MNLLQEYGQELIVKNNLIDKRYIYYYDFELTHDNILKFCEEKLNRKINNYIIINKKFQDKQSLKYHIDDCQLVSMKEPPVFNCLSVSVMTVVGVALDHAQRSLC